MHYKYSVIKIKLVRRANISALFNVHILCSRNNHDFIIIIFNEPTCVTYGLPIHTRTHTHTNTQWTSIELILLCFELY